MMTDKQLAALMRWTEARIELRFAAAQADADVLDEERSNEREARKTLAREFGFDMLDNGTLVNPAGRGST